MSEVADVSSALEPAELGAPRRKPTRLLSRYADGILWLARYIERIENLARILDVTRTFARDDLDGANWLSVVRINSDVDDFFARHPEASGRTVAQFYLLDRQNPTSIANAIDQVRENARTLRAVISTEMWLQINVFHGQIRALDEAAIAPEHLSRVCAMLKEGCQAHTGITEGTFYRDQTWCFYQLGRHIERADQTTRLLDIKFNALLPAATLDAARDADVDAGQWMALLRATAGYHAYRRVHPSGFNPRDVVGFILLNGAFPRSVGLNLAQIDWHLALLRGRYELRQAAQAMSRVDHLRAMLTQQTIDDILQRGLSPFLDWLQRELSLLNGDIADSFFTV